MSFLREKNLVILVVVIFIILFLVYLNKNKNPLELGLINNPKIEKFVETETVSSESSMEEEEQDFSIIPIAIGVNGYPLLCRNNLKCLDVSADVKSSISDNCVTLLNDSGIKIINLGNNSIKYSVFINTGTSQGTGVISEINKWYSKNTDKGSITVKSGSSKTIQFTLTGLYSFLRDGTLYTSQQNSTSHSKNFQIYIN
jgi:hypothetical protein